MGVRADTLENFSDLSFFFEKNGNAQKHNNARNGDPPVFLMGMGGWGVTFFLLNCEKGTIICSLALAVKGQRGNCPLPV